MTKLTTFSLIAALFAFFLVTSPAFAGDAPPLAMPDDASEVVYSGDAGSLTFNSAKSVKELAEFYRGEAKKKGWSETPSVINRDNMAVLTFMAGDDEVNITAMTMGDKTMVTAEGSALESTAAASADAGNGDDSNSAASAQPAETAPPLVAMDKDGLPMPDGLGNQGSTTTLYSKAVNFSAPNSVADIVAFYRSELAKKGWKEDAAQVSDMEAELSFTAPEGPAKLVVKRNGEMSDAELTLNNKAKAAASPLAPKPGKVKILFGNMSDKDAEITIGGKKVKVPAGAGSQGPDGPSLELKPGQLTASMKGAKESFKADADTIWMVGIGPGGLIVVQQ
jgi:hypothetical protein